MLIKIDELKKNHGIEPTGVLHVGAHTGQEYDDYKEAGINKIFFFEANPAIYKELQKSFSKTKDVFVYCLCASDKDGERVTFNITNCGAQSSSIFRLKEHATEHPEVKVEKTLELITTTIDSWAKVHGPDLSGVNFLNIDVQGAELKVLKGMETILKQIKYAYLEVSTKELYENQPLLADIDEFMNKHGFERKHIKMTQHGWGDAFYERSIKSVEELFGKTVKKAPVSQKERVLTHINWLRTKLCTVMSNTFVDTTCNELIDKINSEFE